VKSTLTSSTLALALGALAIVAFNILGWPVKVRFEEPLLNYWTAVALAIALPLSLFAIGLAITSKSLKIACIMAASCTLLPCSVYAFFAQLHARDIEEKGVDLSYLLLGDVPMGRQNMRLYSTNCGATCSYGLELRAEFDIGAGLKIVRPVWSKYRTDPNAKLQLIGPNHIQVLEAGGIVSDVRL